MACDITGTKPVNWPTILTLRKKADNKEVTPHYYVKGEKVSLEEYQNAALDDPALRKIEER